MSGLPDLDAKLRPALVEAQARARRSGKPVLASVTVECMPFEPASLFGRSQISGRVLLQQPSADLAMVAIGVSERIEAQGVARFEDVRSLWRELLENFVADGTATPFAFPLGMAGFAFSPAGQRKRPKVFPAGLLLIPRLLFLATGGRFLLNVTLTASSKTDVEALVQEVEDEALSMLSPETDICPPSNSCEGLSLEDGVDAGTWEAAVESVLAEIERGTIDKVVLARTMRASKKAAFQIEPALRGLMGRFPHCTVFAYALDQACFLGATPERLLRLEGRQVQVDCLAGSTARGRDEAEDGALARSLLANPKERHEHAVVLKALKEALGPLCKSVEAPETPIILRTANVQHLYSPVSALAAPGRDVLEFVARLHPTPATGGYPREAALPLIEKYETFDRGWYAGPCGWIDSQGNGAFVVAIRSALLHGNEATLYAGSGIVAGSEPRREYEETTLKLQAMLWALQQA